jgi:hypothetical protein
MQRRTNAHVLEEAETSVTLAELVRKHGRSTG